MAMAGGIGATVDGRRAGARAFFFGEDQGRYVVPPRPRRPRHLAEAARAGVACARDRRHRRRALTLGGARRLPLPRSAKPMKIGFPRYGASEGTDA